MLYRDRLNAALRENRDAFLEFSRHQSEEALLLEGLLSEIAALDSDSILKRLGDQENTGALPSEEFDGSPGFSMPFAERWRNHEKARAWAASVLQRRTTFAADGSQLYVEKETTLPVGAVQVGWFENPHDPDRPYVKDAEFELLTPADLFSDEVEPADPETRIGETRFHREVEKVQEFLERKKGWRASGEPMPLAFFDGTLLVSFSLPQTRLQKGFIEAMVELVETSRRCEVPVVGYVDRSLSRDIVNFASAFGALEGGRVSLNDAALIHGIPTLLSNWGDRTRFLYSNRKGMGAFADAVTGRSTVGFVYLSTSSGGPPARLDVPSWIFEAGYLDEVADIVRAECVVGVGYPYPIETADAAALISRRDKDLFLKALQDFALREELDFSVSRKDTSKSRRR